MWRRETAAGVAAAQVVKEAVKEKKEADLAFGWPSTLRAAATAEEEVVEPAGTARAAEVVVVAQAAAVTVAGWAEAEELGQSAGTWGCS